MADKLKLWQTVRIRGNHHESLRARSVEEGKQLQTVIDDVIEAGLKVKRIPIVDMQGKVQQSN